MATNVLKSVCNTLIKSSCAFQNWGSVESLEIDVSREAIQAARGNCPCATSRHLHDKIHVKKVGAFLYRWARSAKKMCNNFSYLSSCFAAGDSVVKNKNLGNWSVSPAVITRGRVHAPIYTSWCTGQACLCVAFCFILALLILTFGWRTDKSALLLRLLGRLYYMLCIVYAIYSWKNDPVGLRQPMMHWIIFSLSLTSVLFSHIFGILWIYIPYMYIYI